jgi:cyanophycinase
LSESIMIRSECMAGPLALVGGDEFHPGNEAQDRLLLEAADGRPAYIVATAARDAPDAAVGTAQRWFATLGASVTELRLRTRSDAQAKAIAEQAAGAGLVYIAGGDPGWVVKVLKGSRVWSAISDAWRGGAALAGSSAGAMALCEWTLIRARFPGHTDRRPAEALGLVRGSALLPHFDTFGERWIPSAQATLGAETLLLGVDERTAAVWNDRAWRAAGPGKVTLVKGAERRVFSAPEVIERIPEPS